MSIRCHRRSWLCAAALAGLSSSLPARGLDDEALARQAGGSFPFARVPAVIDGRETIRAHGDPDMPVWGAILSKQEGPALERETVARTKVVQITGYLETVQAKWPG